MVVAGETLEHMPYPPLFLGEVRRVLTAGGLFVGSVPNAYRYRNRLRVLSGKPIDTDPTHLQFFSLASLLALLSERFSVEEIMPIRGDGRAAGRPSSPIASPGAAAAERRRHSRASATQTTPASTTEAPASRGARRPSPSQRLPMNAENRMDSSREATT